MKEFLDYYVVRNNAIKLAHRMFSEGFVPDIIYVPLRGGAYLGNVISEYYKIALRNTDHKPVRYAALVAGSYSGVKNHGDVVIQGWTYPPEKVDPDEKILFVDDIFDSGRTINFIIKHLLSLGLKRENIVIAVHDYKIQEYKNEMPEILPDYYCRKHVIKREEDEIWINYQSHELVGLSKDELENHFYNEDPTLREALSILE